MTKTTNTQVTLLHPHLKIAVYTKTIIYVLKKVIKLQLTFVLKRKLYKLKVYCPQ